MRTERTEVVAAGLLIIALGLVLFVMVGALFSASEGLSVPLAIPGMMAILWGGCVAFPGPTR